MRKSIILLFLPTLVFADFKQEAQLQAEQLKKSLMENLMQKIQSDGVTGAVAFCHENALPLTEQAKLKKLAMGRTSNKFRNEKNKPEDWIKPYLLKAQGTTAKKPYEAQVVKLPSGKEAYLTSLYVAPQCLQCHGKITGAIEEKISSLYPNDFAKNYKVGEFRGFIWVVSD